MENNRKTYITDVLVVGGGLGGAVMAQKPQKPDMVCACCLRKPEMTSMKW